MKIGALIDRDLIVMSDDWGRHPFSCQHLIKRLAPNNRILWVNTVGYRSFAFKKYDCLRALEKLRHFVKNLRPRKGTPDTPSKFVILNPLMVPFGGSRIVREFNAASVSRSVQRVSKRMGFIDPLVLTTLPTTADAISKIEKRLVVYYCVDDFTQWPGVHGPLIRDMEKKLLAQADLVVATSEKLRDTRSNGVRPTQLLGHGVDVSHFKSVAVARVKYPKTNDSPIVAYYGLIDERCDLSLLRSVAARLPEVTFHIIGQWQVERGALGKMPNVMIKGPVSYESLPSCLSRASALILPYAINELAESLSPLKLKEYLATGLPVVATPLPEVLRLSQYIRIANDESSFVNALKQVLDNPGGENSGLQQFLQSNNWDRKAEEFSGMIYRALSEVPATGDKPI